MYLLGRERSQTRSDGPSVMLMVLKELDPLIITLLSFISLCLQLVFKQLLSLIMLLLAFQFERSLLTHGCCNFLRIWYLHSSLRDWFSCIEKQRNGFLKRSAATVSLVPTTVPRDCRI